ncbi:MAG: hypothetical protein K2J67_03540 [Lachnospiraceae bacterium]|nr:hypothetical protein [Lachnospiraceae bacterium]
MKRETRSQTSLLLMVVGIIFIVVAGTVFVSTAWRYLPAAGKQGILFLGTILLFMGSHRMAGSGWMEKTEAALYYLGTACMGLFTLSVCGEWMTAEGGERVLDQLIGWNTEAILIASMIMFLPVVLRFIKKRTVFDFILMALLADWILFWLQIAGGYDWFGSCVISSVGLTVYALADYFRERWTGGNGKIALAFIVLYILHGIRFVACNLTLPLMEDGITVYLGLFLMALFMIGITTLMQLTRNYGVIRVFNSIALYWSLITGANLVYELLADRIHPWSGEMQHFLIFSLCAFCMVALARKEMVVMTAVWGGIIPFFQIWIYGDYNGLFSHISHKVSVYVPFSGVLILAFGLLIFWKERSGRLDREQTLRYVRALAIQGIIMMILFYASQYPFFEKGIYSMLMLQSLAIAFLCNKGIVKRCFQSLAVFFGEILLSICTERMISTDYEVERFCLLAAVGIFLVGVIWRQYGFVIRTFQFVCVCLLMIILLGNALVEGAVGHALVLGVTGVSMLFGASFLNSRRYAVLSSVVLIILVFYITRSFWCSIEWWVYLFAAGVALVVLAIRKERASAKRWQNGA